MGLQHFVLFKRILTFTNMFTLLFLHAKSKRKGLNYLIFLPTNIHIKRPGNIKFLNQINRSVHESQERRFCIRLTSEHTAQAHDS